VDTAWKDTKFRPWFEGEARHFRDFHRNSKFPVTVLLDVPPDVLAEVSPRLMTREDTIVNMYENGRDRGTLNGMSFADYAVDVLDNGPADFVNDGAVQRHVRVRSVVQAALVAAV
jgi:hypothetical protein